MTPRAPAPELAPPAWRVAALLAERTGSNRRFFDGEAERLSSLCHALAERFARGGRLLAVGVGPCAHSDACHVAVEFAHPVIVGKRALPALAIGPDAVDPVRRVRLLARPDDIVVAFSAGEPAVEAAVMAARDRGCLTVGLPLAAAEWSFDPPSTDPFVRQELLETLYHVLWETVHVFFEHPGLVGGRGARAVATAQPAGFLYPFLERREHDLDAVLCSVCDSVRMKASDVGALRTRTLGQPDGLAAAARGVRTALDGGGTLLAFGNGGSATDAMDAVADFIDPPAPWPARPALDLTRDTSILTAVANDVGTEAIFARQVIAYGRGGDVAFAFSTSGSSRNVVRALIEARRRELVTVAFVGGDGGRIAEEGLADHLVLAPSEHIPRIQEAHATAYHVLRELVESLDAPLSPCSGERPA